MGIGRKILVSRKAYIRKSYVKDVKPGPGKKMKRIKATRVKATKYKMIDKGKPGKGPKLIPIKKGKLAPYSTSMPAKKRRRILKKKIRRYGATSVYRSLKAQEIFRKRQRDHAKSVFKSDAEWVKKTYGVGR